MDAEVKAAAPEAEAVGAPKRSTALGMACMAAAAFLFMFGNAIIKLLAASGIHPIEIVFFRSAFSLVLLAPFVLRNKALLRTMRLKLHVTRGMVQAVSMMMFFVGLSKVTLVEATALEFTSPLFATIFAMIFMGERVRARRIIALSLGFAGALIALRPGFADITVGHWLILAASILWAGVLLMIRALSRTEGAITQSVYMGLILTPISCIAASFVWVTPDLHQLVLLLTVGTTATLGQYLFAQAFRLAEMTAVLPLDFTKLIWSSAIGYLVFHTLPDAFVVLGGAIIFAAGAYITLREAQLQRQKRI